MTRLCSAVAIAVLLTGCALPAAAPSPTESRTPTPTELSTAPPLYCKNPTITFLDQPDNTGEVSPLAAAASYVGIDGAAVVVKETRNTATVRIVDASGRTVTELELSANDSGWHVGSITHCTVKESG